MLHVDFAFINVLSVQGFTSYLSFTDDTTSYPFSFPGRNKLPPLDIITFVIEVLQKQGKQVNYTCYDEGGEFARSSEVNCLLITKHIIIHSTG